MNVQFPQRLVSMLMVLMMLFTMNPVYVIAEAGHDHTVETTETPVVTAEEAITVSAVAELVVSATASASYVYAGEEPVAVSAKISGGVAPYEVTLQAVKDGSIVSTSKVTTESASASLSFAPASYGDYELVVLVHDAAHTEVLTSVSLAVAEQDKESSEQWAASVAGASVSGNWASSLVSVAKTQIGYAESVKDFTVNGGAKQGYSRYGAWYGAPYSAWNAAFVAFVADYANVPTDALLAGYGYRSWVNGMSSKSAYEKVGSGYAPKAGDIAFLSGSRVAIIESVSGDTVNVIEGDVNGKVARQQYAMSKVVGFGNTALMQGLYNGTATVVPTATPVATPVPEGVPTATPTATPKPTATPVPEIEGEMEFVATPVPGPGVTVAPKDDMDILDMMTGDMGSTVEQMAAQATSVPTVFSEAFYAMQAEVQALYAKYMGEATSEEEIKAFVESLELGDLHYLSMEFETLGDYAQSIGLTEYEGRALDEMEPGAELIRQVTMRVAEMNAERAGDITPCEGININVSGSGSFANETLTATAKGSGGIFGLGAKSATNTITISATTAGEVSFSWTGTSINSLTLDGVDVSKTEGSFGPKMLAAGESVVMVITTAKNNTTNTLNLSNFTHTPPTDENVTFVFDESKGLVSVAGVDIENGATVQVGGTGAQLIATPANGFAFIAWTDADGKFLSTASTYTLFPTAGLTVKAIFDSNTDPDAYFLVDKTYLTNDLNAASSLGTVIALHNNGTLREGEYVIPNGKTLLIPMDDAHTVYTTAPAVVDDSVQPTAYRTLMMAEGAQLFINGEMSIPAKHNNANGGWPGGDPSGPAGFVRMAPGSKITVNSGGKLYAYGFITAPTAGGDSGTVLIESGGVVYEYFQFTDFRGGTQSTQMKNAVFPLSQYYVQNVEVPMTIMCGAMEYSYTTINMTLVTANNYSSSVGFIGTQGTMFNLKNGYVVKRYDGKTDRMIIDGYGDIDVSGIAMKVGISSIDSADYVLPVGSNFTVNVHKGTITMSQDIALLPGAIVRVGKDAHCELKSAGSSGTVVNVFVYDAADWGTYVHSSYAANNSNWGFTGTAGMMVPVVYAPGQVKHRTVADLVDAQLIVEGTIDASSGALYTTAGGAGIIGYEGARAVISTGAETVTYQLVQGGDPEYPEIPITTAKLRHGDDTYTDPTTYAANNTYIYHNDRWVLCSTSEDGSTWTHTYDYKEETTTEATCNTAGVKTLTCVCGATKTEEIPATGVHTYTEATCTEVSKCSGCGEANPNDTELKPHDVDGQPLNVVTVANCATETNGSGWRECKVCSSQVDEVIAWAHTPGTPEIVEATCVAKGSTVISCTVCSQQISSEEIPVDENAHLYNDGEVTTAAGCTTVGVMTFTCTREGCGDFYTEEIKATGHTPDRDKATCTEDQICTVCTTVIAAATGHLNTETVAGTPATCQATGLSEGTRCKDCGIFTVPQVTLGIADHDWDEGVVKTPASCTAAGEMLYTCQTEGCYADTEKTEKTTKIEVIDQLPHTEATIPGTPATCGATGLTDGVKCSVCGEWITKQETIPATGDHNYTVYVASESKAPDCSTATNKDCTDGTDGYSVYKCNGCDATQKTTIEAKHDFEGEGGSTVVTDPTCEAAGYTTYTCATCENVYKVTGDPSLGHSYTNEVSKDATCEVAGYVRNYCANGCGKFEAVSNTPALGHNFDIEKGATYTVTTPATCEEDGLRVVTCANGCGKTEEQTIEKTGHAMPDTWTQTKAPSCTEEGVEQRVCANGCGKAETREVAMTAHNIVTDEGYAATCTQPGLASGSHCTTCDTQTIERKVISPLGHQYHDENGDGVIDHNDAEYFEPTCVQNGYWIYTCIGNATRHTAADGDVNQIVQDENSATGHSWGTDAEAGWEIVTPATCTVAGKEQRICSNPKCSVEGGYTENREIPVLEHQYVPMETAPTCIEQGYTTYTCSNADCGHSYVDENSYVPATGHSWGEDKEIGWEVSIPATCTEAGEEKRVCTHENCGETETRTIDALQHAWGDWEEIVPAICGQNGTNQRVCANDPTHVDTVSIPMPAEEHTWVYACEHDDKCSTCGYIAEGTAKDHNLSAATCIAPATCQYEYCDYTEGEVDTENGHAYDTQGDLVSKATCMMPAVYTYICSHCNGTTEKEYGSVDTINGHSMLRDDNAKAATCLAPGYNSGWYCENGCGTVVSGSTIPQLDHNYEEIERVDATCTEDGYVKTKCTNGCEDVQTETLEALKHDYTGENGTVVHNATCEADKYTVYTCQREGCDYTETETEEGTKLAHNYEEIERVAATCTEAGYVKTKCTNGCEDVQTETLEALKHDYTGENGTVVHNATCEADKYTVYTCQREGCDYTETVTEEGTKLDHNYEEIERVAATCTEDGYVKTQCKSGCEDVKTEVLTKLNHDYTGENGTVVHEATCEADKYTVYTCQREGCDYTETVTEEGTKLDHNYEEIERVAATCTEDGYVKTQCKSGCEDVKTEVLTKLKHDYTGENGTVVHEATCESDKYTVYTCQREGCDYTETVTEEETKLDHNYKEIERVAATCTANGYVKTQCTNGCEDVKTEVLTKLGHNYYLADGTLDASKGVPTQYKCEELIITLYTCTRCEEGVDGHTYEHTSEEPLAHDLKHEVAVDPTCTTTGLAATSTCQREGCDYTSGGETIPALGHDYLDAEKNADCITRICQREGCGVTVDPTGVHTYEETGKIDSTCVTEGLLTETCTKCGDEKETTISVKTDHTWGAWETKQEATCKAEGYQERTCTVEGCGAVDTEKNELAIVDCVYENKEYTEATCSAAGYWTETCKWCGEKKVTEDENAPATGEHDYKETSKTESTCVVAGKLMETCSVCNDVKETELALADHTWGVWETKQEATCKAEGYQERTCTVEGCGTVDTEKNELAIVDCVYENKEYTEATCGAAGYWTETCKWCGEKKVTEDENAPATGAHDYKETSKNESTCVVAGMLVETCSVCNDVKETELALADHTWGEWETKQEATCKAEGYQERTCTVEGCGAVDTEKNELAIVDCVYENKEYTEATCGAAGYWTETCKWCGEKKVTEDENAPATGLHDYKETSKTESTCVVAGKLVETCSVCNDVKETELALANHKEDVLIPQKAPTCTEDGHGFGISCSVCGYEVLKPEVIPAAHTWNNGVVTTEATCTEDGVRTCTCTVVGCGATKTDPIPNLGGHVEEVLEAKEATCTETGLTEGKKCSVCGDILLKQEIEPAKGHAFTEEDKDRICAVRTCTECGEDIEPEEGIPHTFAEDVAEAICAVRICKVCGDEIQPAEGVEHNYDDGVVTTVPTHFATGVKTFTCQRRGCGYTYTEPVDKIEHTYSKVVTDPTCVEQGYTTYTCECGDTYVSDYVNATGNHTYGEWVIDQDSTCTVAGSKHRTCTVCEKATEDGTVELKPHTEETIPAVPSTCTTPGKSEGKQCSVCDTVTVKPVTQPLANHELKNYEYIPAECLKAGQEAKGQYCVNCTYKTDANAPYVIPAPGHSMVPDKGYAATCTTDGLTDGSHCANCDEATTEQEVIPATGHQNTTKYAEEPSTCTVKGKSAGEYCEDCKTWLTPRQDLALAPHTEKIIAAVAPTCTTAGSTEGKYCSVCEITIVSVTSIPANGHTEVIDEAVEPTCTETGKTEGKHCSVCGTIIVAQKNVAANGHTEVIDKAIAPTCTEKGKTEGKHCSVCNEIIVAQEDVDAAGHTEVIDKAIAPTCTEKGKTEGKHCSVCNEIIVAQEDVDANGHTEQIIAAVKPSCTVAGLTEGLKCSVCNTILKAQESDPALGHTEVIDAAVPVTCTTDGKTEGKHCSVCEAVLVKQEVITAKGHTIVVDKAIAETCTTEGKTEGSHCSVCDEILVAQEIIPATGHTVVIDEGVDATCLDAGKTEGKHCSDCDAVLVKQNVIPAKGHTPEVVAAVAPTCTEDGLKEGSVCAVCELVLIKQVVDPKLGHDWDAGVEEPKHTCTEAGIMTYTCNRCGETKTEDVLASHTMVTDAYVAPTCTETGLTEGSHCSECDYVKVPQEIIPATHTWKDVEVLVQPTCTSTGSKTVICAVEGCGATETQIIEKLPHTEVIDPAVEETCTTDGKTEGSHCSVCNTTLVAQETIEAHHVFDVAPCTQVPATCQREGCDHVVTELVKHDLAPANCTTPATCKYGCGYTEGTVVHQPEVLEEIPAQCLEPGKTEGSRCALCGRTLVPQKTIDALGHNIVKHEAKKPTFTSVGWKAYENCTRCAYTTYVEIASLGEQSIDSFEELITYLPYLEQWAVEYAKITPNVDPVDLLIKYIRTGVDRYNSGSWGIMAGYENPGFAKYVNEKEDEHNAEFDKVEDMIQVSGLKNLNEFDLPNGNHADLGHMFGTMDITYNNKGSVNHADVGGWAGDLVDLLSTVDHDDHQEALNAVVQGDLDKNFEPMVTFIRTELLGFDTGHGDDFAKNDIWGDLDAFYIMQTLDAENYEAGDLTDIFTSYFVASLNDRQRADFLLAHRLDDVTTRSAIREAVYNAYTTNSVISTLEGTREFVNIKDNDELIIKRKAVCYAFADWLCIEAGDWVKDTDNPYLTDYEATYSLLAPGISMEIHKATSADGLNMVYYLGYADVGRDDVHVMANYKTRNAESWGMSRVLDQANDAKVYHSNPEDEAYPEGTYIENFEPIIATNAAGFNMSTGEPSGLLVMNGIEYHMIDGQGFFGITEDGRAVIGSKEDYENKYKGKLLEGVAGFGTMLVKDGELAITATSNYYNDRASRTAIGITPSGRVVVMVLDGRQIPWSCGGSMIEIAQIMKLAGCEVAVNLDGGGSTTFVARQAGDEELSLVNRPSDGVQRSVSTSLLIASTAPSSTEFERAIIEADYNFMTAGATVNVKATGLSATNNIVDLPEGTYWTVSNEARASVTEDGVVTTDPNYVPKDENDNSFEVNLVLDGNVLATKTLTVVIPDMLYFDREKIDGIYGKATTLPLKARYEGKDVSFRADDVAFTIDTPVDMQPAGVMEGFDFVAVEESDIKTVKVTAELVANKEVTATITVILYKEDENNFNFDNATGGDRQLAWKRVVTNSTHEETTDTYYVVDADEPMVTSYTIALDMSQIPIPAKLESLTYMLPGADTPDASAWFFLLNLAQRISDMTEVTPKITIDPNFDVDYSELKIINDYFELTGKEFDEATNTLTLKLNWKRVTHAIDVATANPMCIVSGLKLTPKEDAEQTLKVVNKADISYVVYMRANALYTFANKPENQKVFDLYPYVDNREGPYKGESGGYFSATYATFEDTYTLNRAMKNGWVVEAGGFRYYIDNEYLVGIHLIDGLYYQFDENGINVGQTPYTGKHAMPDEKGTVYHYYMKNGEVFKGWITLDDGNWYFYDWSTGRGQNGTLKVPIKDEEGETFYPVYEFENGRLLDGYWWRTDIGWRYYYGPYYYKQGWRQLNNKDGEPAMYFFEAYYVQKGVSPVQEAHAIYEYWYEFTEGENAPGQLVGHAKEGLYWWDDDWHQGEGYGKDAELYYVKEKAEGEYSLAFKGGVAYVDGHYYYFPMNGQAWRNKIDWVNASSANGLLPEGNYRFGNDGKIDMSTSIDNENGTLYYYYNGKRTANAGIVEFEGEKYYIGSGAIATVGASVWVSDAKTNGLVPGAGTYYFDEDGHLIKQAAIIKEGDIYYYYNDSGKREANAGLVMFEGAYYYIGAEGKAVVDSEANVTKTNGLLSAGTYRFDENGKAILTTEMVEENGKLNYYVNGKLNKDAGLVEFQGAYYYITVDGSAVRGAEQEVTEAKTNGLFPADTYEFAADGKMVIREGIYNGYYYVAGAKKAAGLVKVGEDYYYAAEGGKLVTDAKYDVVKTNELVPAGFYRFDEDGKAIMTTEVVAEDDKLAYYKDGRLDVDAGLVKVGENYYYILADGNAVADAKHNVTKTNGLLTAGYYRFDEDGKAIMTTELVDEGDHLAYYKDGRLAVGANLIKYGEDYYFIDRVGNAVVNTKYAVSAGDILPEGIYRIGADGKFIMATELVDEHGNLTYYKNGVLTKDAGLIEMDDAYYYIDEFGYAVKDTKQNVQKTNGLLPAGVYRFGADAKAILTTELVNEDGKLAYYKNGMLTKDAGLININAAYYYIDADGCAVTDVEMLVEKTNDLLPAGTYRFGEDGKAILTTELVEEDGKLNYYVQGMLAKNAGLIQYEGAYYYITEDGSAAQGTKVNVTEEKANNLFPADTYEFGADGKMVIYDGVIVNGYYYEDGVKTAAGLVKVDGDYYYAAEGGKIAVSEKVAVTEEKANNLFPADTYEFGADGKMVIYDGVIVNGYYYEDGVKTAAGLVKVDGDYYYAAEGGKIVTDAKYDVTKNNDLLPAGIYRIDEDGKLNLTTEVADEDGKLVYYENGKLAKDAGLVKVGEDYYYIDKDGVAVTNAMVDVTASKTNGLFPADTYKFGADGKMVIYDGVIVNGYYYEDGVKTDAGLVKVGEDYYYAGEGGKIVTDTTMVVEKTNGLLPEDEYTFGEDGKLILVKRLPGDADDNGVVDILDALLTLQHSVGWELEINLENANVNGDTAVDIMDALTILQYSVGWEIELL